MANPRDTKRPKSDAEMRSVTDDLASRIQRAQSERAVPAARGDSQQSGMAGANRGFRLASEFVAAIIVGGALGYGADLLFGTRPWAMVILLLLGFVAGIVNMVRTTRELNAETAVPPGTAAVPDDDDDK